ncbi:Tigger transposable element-derived protein 6 [Dictyocoela muelleri]|nr:Tigger transposable element-derived protein 6 [Dictyocoela muelleri]
MEESLKLKNRIRLTIKQKKEIIQFRDKNPFLSQREIAATFKISLSTVNGILKNSEQLLKIEENLTCKKVANNFSSKVFDQKLFEWFNLKRRRFCTIQDLNLQEMALKLATLYKVENFKASNGFLQKFKNRHNISSKFVKGESGLVNEETISYFKNEYEIKLKSYDKKDIFNCDETGFFFKCTPNKTLCHRDEDQISGKFSKERITILFCVSMTGEKLNPLLIGKSKTPRGFKDLDFEKLKISYDYSQKAWMNLEIFKKWLDSLNLKMKESKRKILLTLDNAPVHPIGLEFSNLELFYFPPGVTSKIQPLDQGIIRSFKVLYKQKLNLKMNFEMEMDQNITYNEVVKRFSLFDSIKLILESWENITTETIVNCYRKSIENSMLNLEELDSIQTPLIDENVFSCYSTIENDEEFFIEIEKDIEQAELNIEKNKEQSEELDLDDGIYKHELTHFEALEYVNKLENYLIKHDPDNLDTIYLLKDKLNASKSKRQLNMLDFIRRK